MSEAYGKIFTIAAQDAGILVVDDQPGFISLFPLSVEAGPDDPPSGDHLDVHDLFDDFGSGLDALKNDKERHAACACWETIVGAWLNQIRDIRKSYEA